MNQNLIAQLSQGNPNPRFCGPYSHHHRILTIGDGNLSFSLALASELGGAKITATTFDTRDAVVTKYPEGDGVIRTLRSLGARVFHGVDGTKLEEFGNTVAGPFDRIVFNYPHVGGSTQEDVLVNRELLTGFFRSAAARLAPASEGGAAGEIHVTLRKTPFYDSWKIHDLAREAGLVLAKEFPFEGAKFAGYEPRRTSPAVREAPSTEGARVYTFRVKATAAGAGEDAGKAAKKARKDKKRKERQRLERDRAEQQQEAAGEAEGEEARGRNAKAHHAAGVRSGNHGGSHQPSPVIAKVKAVALRKPHPPANPAQGGSQKKRERPVEDRRAHPTPQVSQRKKMKLS